MPPKLTLALIDEIVMAVRAGNYIETACAYAGIHKDSYYEWLKIGAAAKTKDEATLTERERLCLSFSYRIAQAWAFAEVQDMTAIGEAGKTEWTALAWRLERKIPGRYGRRKETEPETAVPFFLDEFMQAVLERREKRLERLRRERTTVEVRHEPQTT
jgi:hypothetical protein